MANVYVPNFTRLKLGGLVPSVMSVADVQQAMKDTDNEDIYVPGVPSSGLTGGVQEVSVAAAGSGYTDGSYTGVALTGGSGSNAKASITIASNAISGTPTITTAGTGYKLNEELSFADADVGGGGGSGGKLKITNLS